MFWRLLVVLIGVSGSFRFGSLLDAIQPESPQYSVIKLALQVMDVKHATLARVKAGQSFGDPVDIAPLPDMAFQLKFRVEQKMVQQHNVFTISPRGPTSGITIFYLHGGAYSTSFQNLHWQFLAWLVQTSQCTVVAPDYPLAPGTTWQKAFPMVERAYRELLATVSASNIIMMGDSAGGGLALALAEKWRDAGLANPARLVLLSPWLDLSMTNPAISPLASRDPILDIEALRISGQHWAGLDPSTIWQLSPLYGQLDGLPPIDLFSGTADILNPDARLLRDKLSATARSLQFHEFPDMIHVWMLLDMPESLVAREEILAIINVKP